MAREVLVKALQEALIAITIAAVTAVVSDTTMLERVLRRRCDSCKGEESPSN